MRENENVLTTDKASNFHGNETDTHFTVLQLTKQLQFSTLNKRQFIEIKIRTHIQQILTKETLKEARKIRTLHCSLPGASQGTCPICSQ